MTTDTGRLDAVSAAHWATVVAVMLTAILEVLDMTIVNVSLPYMLGTFGATPDQITWVLTSYLVSSAIVMPLTGYLSARLGRRRLLFFAITGFVVSSALCGAAWSLEAMVGFRLLQGICGATLVPLSQSILIDTFPRDRRGQAMAIWGLGIMVAPILGPTLGGWLTEIYGWRSIFYVNVPVGALALLLILGRLEQREIRPIKTDWFGLTLLALAIGGLQLILDQGETRDWFDSRLIQVFAVTVVVSGAIFVMRGWSKPDNIVDLSLFRDRNFAAASAAMAAFGIGMFGTIVLLPLMLERLLGYPAETTGLVLAPRAIASGVTMAVFGRLIGRIDPRHMIASGLSLAAAATFAMTHYNLDLSPVWIVWPGVLQGVGLGLVFVPLSTIAFESLPTAKSDEASGLFSLMRVLGASIGISIVGTLLARRTQIHWSGLSGHVRPDNPALWAWLQPQGLDLADPLAIQRVTAEVARQAQMLAFVDLFWLIGWSFLALLPLVLLMRKGKH